MHRHESANNPTQFSSDLERQLSLLSAEAIENLTLIPPLPQNFNFKLINEVSFRRFDYTWNKEKVMVCNKKWPHHRLINNVGISLSARAERLGAAPGGGRRNGAAPVELSARAELL